MKKIVSTAILSTLITLAWAQIPDPEYIPSEYQSGVSENSEDSVSNQVLDTDVNPNKPKKLEPKLYIGFGNFNFRGDISDSRNSGLIGQSGFQIGLAASLNENIDAALIMQEGVVRVDGISRDDLPKNFKSTLNSIGFRFNYNLNKSSSQNKLTPYIGLGLNYLKFDSKGSNDDSNNEYEIDLLSEWILNPENTEAYSQTAIEIPITLGVKFKINDRLNLNFSSAYHYTNSDYIDNIVDGSSDKYFVNSVHAVYDLYCKNCEEDDYVPQVHDDYLVNFESLDREDEDGDGVADIDDFCIGTPSRVKVDAVGCPVDTDNDDVPDYLDKEPNTPQGAVVSVNGVQLTDKMSEAIYLNYLNATSRKDASSYFDENYPTDKFIKITKEVVNIDGDTLMVDIFKPKVFQQIFEQQKEFDETVTTSQYIDLNSKTYYKIQMAKHSKGMDASEINRLMSISNIKSTIEGDYTSYYSGEYEDLMKANQRQKQLINSGYSNTYIVEDKQGDLRSVTSDEINRERNLRASAKLEDLPPLQDIVFRVQLDVLKEVDLDFYDLDELVIFEDNEGFKHVFTEGYSSYEEALERRNELYFMSYENAKVVAIKEGELVDAKEYMDIGYTEENASVYGDVIFKIQLGIYSKNEVVEIAKINELEGVEKTEISNGIFRYTTGTFTNIQAAMLRLEKVTKMGYDGCYPIAFYNNEQISIKKAKELIGL